MSVTGDRLRERMLEAGVSQEDLAAAVGCTQGTISQILLGTTRNSRFLPRIAEHLGVSLAWLLGSIDERQQEAIGELLAPDERQLVARFRTISLHDRTAILSIVNSLADLTVQLSATHRG